jgi:hypothetical protein
MDNRLTLDELIDAVRMNLTLNCKLPYTLGNENIERIITFDALRWFYREYKYALQRTYYYVDLQSFWKNNSNGIKFLTLPDEIEAVRWIYMVGYNDMRNLGYMLPNNSIALSATTTPFVAAINVSEFAESVAVMQSMQDAISTFSKNTVKFTFDPNSKRFEVQTSLNSNLILEVYAQIPPEALFGDPYFIKYVTGMAMMDYATHLSFVDMQLAGNTKISTDRIYDRGDKLVQEVKDYIKGITRGSFFFNKTR